MITRIGIENFKSFPNQEFIEPLPFTLLIGDNGSGKSTYIQTLAFMSQNPDVISIADGQFINQGGFDQLVYDKERVLTIHVDGKITQDAEGYSYLNDIIYHLDIKFDILYVEVMFCFLPFSRVVFFLFQVCLPLLVNLLSK